MAFRFLHMADVHLDTPFKSRDSILRNLLRDSIRQAFESAVDLALTQKVQAVLIAGDLFDNDTLSFATEKFLLQQMNRLYESKIKVYYAPGNHDPGGSSYRQAKLSWPSNVHIFNTCRPESCPVLDDSGKIIAVINGAGHENKKESRNLVKDFQEAEDGIIHVGLIHALITGAGTSSRHERYAPCTLEDLKGKGYAYWALGHVHTCTEFNEGLRAVYPGNITGRNPSETGQKGVYVVEIGDTGAVKTEFWPLSPLCWETITVDGIQDEADLNSLEQKIYKSTASYMETLEYPARLLPRIQLSGSSPLWRELMDEAELDTLADNLKTALNLDFLELVSDGLKRFVEPSLYRNEPHVLSAALSIYDRLKEDDDYLLEIIKREKIAGCPTGASREETLEYLRGLLCDLDYEIADRLIGGEGR